MLGPTHLTDYIYVDFASGAGGPTPEIERLVNQQLEASGSSASKDGGGRRANGARDGDVEEKALFVLTDLRPHLSAWQAASKKSENLRFVAESVDAADAPRDLVERVVGGEAEGGRRNKKKQKQEKVMRLFSLAFHHFDDELAERILRNTVECGDGFA